MWNVTSCDISSGLGSKVCTAALALGNLTGGCSTGDCKNNQYTIHIISTSEQGHSGGADPGLPLSSDQGFSKRRRTNKVCLRIGTANIGAMSKRSGEVVDLVGRRNLDFCCLQETRWKGGNAKTMGEEGKRYKFFWQGCKESTSGVGILVTER